MNTIYVFGVSPRGPRAGPVEGADTDVLENLATDLHRIFGTACRHRQQHMDIAFARDDLRDQYHSTAILQRMDAMEKGEGACLLGVATVDLYVPVLTFVFGEAQLGGHCAIVSLARLRQKFYGLPADTELLRARLAKEAAHELGHTMGLKHCFDWRCAMASSSSVERIDLKEAALCAACLAQVKMTSGRSMQLVEKQSMDLKI